MISPAIILWPLAAIMKAVADTLLYQFNQSVFKKMAWTFWNPPVSSINAKKIFGYKIDGWHMSNSAMILLVGFCMIFHKPMLPWYYEITIAGPLWWLPFNLFYYRILRKK